MPTNGVGRPLLRMALIRLVGAWILTNSVLPHKSRRYIVCGRRIGEEKREVTGSAPVLLVAEAIFLTTDAPVFQLAANTGKD
jgi:hypothetical protein